MSALLDRLSIAHPIIQAPMGGGPTTPELVAAVSGAGALGSIAAGYLTAEALREEIRRVRELTDRPFAVNLFVGGETEGAGDASPMLALLTRWHQRLGLDPPQPLSPPPSELARQIEVVLEEGVPVVSFTFGIPPGDVIHALHTAGALLIGTATTVDEGRSVEQAGMDAVVVQGYEAGAHRGTFAASFEDALIGTVALVPQVADAVRIPVIASGGIMDGRGIVAAQALGAVGVQMGTAFLVAEEAGTARAYRDAVLAAGEAPTAVTRAFSGRPARALRNGFMEEVERGGVPIPPYPLQNTLTRPMRAAAARAMEPEALSLYVGQGVALARAAPAAELVGRLVAEAAAARARLAR